MGEDEVQVEKSNMETQHESQELLVPSDPQPSDPQHSDAQPSVPSNPVQLDETHEVNAITVLTLLDQLVKMLDSVQEKQQHMEEWQHVMEESVRHIQNDMNKLVKSNSVTTNSVSKLLEKNRKISAVMKDVREKMERQTCQVKKLEDNHNYLLHRDNFRVLIFQDENEIPSSVFVKDPSRDAESLSPDANRSQEEEELHTVQLSSDEDLDEEPEDEEEGLETMMMEPLEKSRAEKIKRSSLKKVDSLKKAFSRENFEKKMNKIVSVEKREKIKKSLSQKNKGGSFKIFHIKKNREGGEKHAESGSFSEIHADLAPAQDEEAENEELAKEKMGGDKEKEEEEEVEKQEVEKEEVEKQEVEKEEVEKQEAEKEEEEKHEVEKEEVSLDDNDDAECDLSITEGLRAEYTLSSTLPQGTSHISHNTMHGVEEGEGDQREKEDGDAYEEESMTVGQRA